MDRDSILERERYQMQQIRELELEELQIEEVDGLNESDDEAFTDHGYRGAASSSEFTYDTCLASLHTYLGEVEDTHHRLTFLEGGAVWALPLFYLEGAVLFPEATLPLRVIQSNFVAALEKVLNRAEALHTIGVVHVQSDPHGGRLRFATIGTTAEIRQYRRLEDHSLNVVTRGQQRFHLRRGWIDDEGVPFGEVQIIQEDLPLRTPRDAFEKLPPLSNFPGLKCPSISQPNISHAKQCRPGDKESASESNSEESFVSELSPAEMSMHQSAIDSCYGYDTIDESTSSDDEKFVCESELQLGRSLLNEPTGSVHVDYERKNKKTCLEVRNKSMSGTQSCKGKGLSEGTRTKLNQPYGVPRAFWPYWVYRMYDSYHLAHKAAGMWKQIVGAPSMDDLVKRPDLLSFHIGSKIPLSESIRQELLEIDGTSYRLRREIELLESFDRVRCKSCQTVIAKRSDMLVMSSEGPLGAYVNPNGFVYEIMTLYKANGLDLYGNPVKEYSWFPGYAWTISHCATCKKQMGWLFTATNKRLKPELFWGIRSSQIADDMR